MGQPQGTAHLQVPALSSQSQQADQDEVTLKFASGGHAGPAAAAGLPAPEVSGFASQAHPG